MTPTFTRFYFGNLRAVDAVGTSKFGLTHPRGAYLNDILLSKLGSSALPSSRGNKPSLSGSFFEVLFLRSPSQMPWIYAWRVIARMERELVGPMAGTTIDGQCSMGCLHSRPFAQIEESVAPCSPAHPWPTFVGASLVNFGPETCSRFFSKFVYRKQSHGAESLRGGQGRALLTQRFRPVFLSRTARKLQRRERCLAA